MERLKAHLSQLSTLERQRKGWLVLSFFVASMIAVIIFRWDSIITDHLVWMFASTGLLLSIIWWYWSMRLVRFVLRYKMEESEILQDIVLEIRSIKNDVKFLATTQVDKDK